MRNPLGSESAAFRFLLFAVAGTAAVTAAAILAGARAALLVSAAVMGGAVVHYGRRRRERVLRTAPGHVWSKPERRLLVLVQAPLPAERLEEIGRRADRVLVVSASDAPSVRRWASDVDGARAGARLRVDETVSRLTAMHAATEGTVGDDDPVQAIEDALRAFGGDEIVVSTAGSARGEVVASRLRQRFALPVTHVAC